MILLLVALQFLTIALLLDLARRQKKTIFLIRKMHAALMPVVAVSIEVYTTIDGQEQRIQDMNLKVTQKIPLIAKGKDKKGNPAPLDGQPSFTSSDESLAVIEVVDGVSYLKPVGPLGVVSVAADADGDVGEGVKALHFEGAVNLIAGDAEVLDLEFGEPVDQE